AQANPPSGTIRVSDNRYPGIATYSTLESVSILSAPVPAITIPAISEGQNLQFSVNAAIPFGTHRGTFEVDLNGDGEFGDIGSQTGAGGVSLNFAITWEDLKGLGIADSGNYLVTVRVTDSAGVAGESLGTLVVNNQAPTLSVSGADSVAQGLTYSLALSSSDPGADTISSWTINWGDEAQGAPGEFIRGNPSLVTHTYSSPGNFQIVATATDEDGSYSAPPKSVTILFVPPPVVISGADSTAEGQNYLLTLAAPIAGAAAVAPTWLIDWGDGSATENAAGSNLSLSHLFIDDSAHAQAGAFTIKVTGAGNGGIVTVTKPVTVVNTAPTLHADGLSQVNEGDVYSLTL
ncbi:MAG TPA: PKD domain-containing protein, partial [Candidatus Dormibacteraeota bacterium]|nr:PKD domain-containing protein [Candidatus Dormibacteraeota bacterium]